MREIILEKRYPHSREEDITDAFMRGYEIGKEQEHRWWSAFCANCKTESNSEIPNNCEVKNYCDDCLYTDTCDSKEFFYACTSKSTISKMEQVDKDTNVRSKDEPNCEECKHFHENAVMYLDQCDFCFKDCKYEPKDEPQTDCLTCRYNGDEWDSPKCDGCSKVHSNYEPQIIKVGMATDSVTGKVLGVTLDTDCAWK